MSKVLCVCTNNTARSPMMAALLQRELGDEFVVESAGIWRDREGYPADPFAIQVMLERGIDISDHRARRMLDEEDFNLYGAEHVVCASEKTENEIIIYLAGDRVTQCFVANEAGGGIKLRPGATLEEFRECADFIASVVPDIANQIHASK